MAKRGRGRPPKPKIKTVKNPVGRPYGGKKLTAKEIELIREWNYLNFNSNYTAFEKKKIICEKKFVSVAKLEKAIGLFNKMVRKGIICNVPPNYDPQKYVVMFPCHPSTPANDYATITIMESAKQAIKLEKQN